MEGLEPWPWWVWSTGHPCLAVLQGVLQWQADSSGSGMSSLAISVPCGRTLQAASGLELATGLMEAAGLLPLPTLHRCGSPRRPLGSPLLTTFCLVPASQEIQTASPPEEGPVAILMATVIPSVCEHEISKYLQ